MICRVMRLSISSIVGAATCTGGLCATTRRSAASSQGAAGFVDGRHGVGGVVPGGLVALAASAIARVFLAGHFRFLRLVLAGILGQGVRIGLAVGADSRRPQGDLAGFDELAADLGDQFPPDAQLLGEVAVGTVVVEPQLDLDRPSPFQAGEREAVEQVGSGHVVERVVERAEQDLGGDRLAPEAHGRGVPVEAVGQEELAVDLVDRDRRHPAPGVHVAVNRVVVETIAQVQGRVEHHIFEKDLGNLHRPPLPRFAA